jgi:hypothetical protein
MEFRGKPISKRFWLIALTMIVTMSVIGYAAILDYTLDISSNVVVVSASPGLQLIASDNTTVVTSITFGDITQGEAGTWSGYLNNTGNVALRTFAIGSPDLGSVGTVTWDVPETGYLGVDEKCPATIALHINQTADLGSHAFTIRITGSPTTSGPTTVVITATDLQDPFSRFWAVTFDRPMPPETPQQGYPNADFNKIHYSGDTMVVDKILLPGAHYLEFIVSQTGGPAYGEYSGTITINGQQFSISGVYSGHPTHIDFLV